MVYALLVIVLVLVSAYVYLLYRMYTSGNPYLQWTAVGLVLLPALGSVLGIVPRFA